MTVPNFMFAGGKVMSNEVILPHPGKEESQTRDSEYSACKPRTLRLACKWILLVNVVWACFLTIVLVVWHTLHNSKNPPRDEPFCVPCYQLVQGPFVEDNKEIFRLDTSSSDLKTADCCAKTNDQVATIFHLIYQRKEQQELTREILEKEKENNARRNKTSSLFSGRRVIAHVLFGRQPNMKRSANIYEYEIRNWLPNRNLAVLQNIKLINGRLRIAESGYYRLYSQMYFVLESSTKIQQGNTKVLIHSIKRYNAIYPNDGQETLAKNKETKCWTDKGIVDHTSSITGTFYLRYGDHVFVTVSDISVVSRNPETSWFGLNRL